jgi:DnaJ-class molecular chaperone
MGTGIGDWTELKSTCDDCNGSGNEYYDWEHCGACDGEGFIYMGSGSSLF